MITHTHCIIAMIACSTALIDIQVGSITSSSPTFDRRSATGADLTGSCDADAPDSFNNGVPYEEYFFRPGPGGAFLQVFALSLEPTPLDLDPFIAIYCGEFDPDFPNLNLLQLDDDSAGYPNAVAVQLDMIPANALYTAVVSSYSNFPQSRYGDFQIVLGNNLFFSSPCPADLNDDGQLDFLDISQFLNAYSTAGSAADLNFDGLVDFLDISLFLTYYNSGCP